MARSPTATHRNAPHLHTLLVHCLRRSAGPSATPGLRGLRCQPPARGRQLNCAHLSRIPHQCHLRAPSRQVPRRLTPISPFLSARQPWGGDGGLAARLPTASAAGRRPRGSFGPRDAGARVWNGRGAGSAAKPALQGIRKHQR